MQTTKELLTQIGTITMLTSGLLITGLLSDSIVWYLATLIINLIILIATIKSLMEVQREQRPTNEKEHARNTTLSTPLQLRTPRKHPTRKREV